MACVCARLWQRSACLLVPAARHSQVPVRLVGPSQVSGQLADLLGDRSEHGAANPVHRPQLFVGDKLGRQQGR